MDLQRLIKQKKLIIQFLMNFNFNANISVPVVYKFITIALNEGRRMIHYVEMTGLLKSTISRHLLELGLAKFRTQ